MRFCIRATEANGVFELAELGTERIAYRGNFGGVCAMSVLLNYEQMRLDGEIGGSVPQIDRIWPRDWRHPHRPVRLSEQSVPSCGKRP